MSNSRRCAACRYLRRKCPKDCIFGPYFPSTNLDRFVCVHKIFGASNIAKMLKQVPEGRRKEAAESLVLEARYRVRDPVYGSVGIITQLREQIMEAEYELAKTQGLIALCHAQFLHEHQPKLETENTTFTSQIQDDLHFDYSLQLNSLQKQESTSLGHFNDEFSLY